MGLIICFSAAVILLILTAVLFSRSDKKLLTAGAGSFLALCILLLPLGDYTSASNILNTVIVTIVNSMKIFGLDGDFFAPELDFGQLPTWFAMLYITILNLLYLTAPLLTIGLVISFFRNAASKIKLALSGVKEVYVFSAHNTRSVMLAEDIAKKFPRAAIIFYNTEKADVESVKGAICFEHDISGISSRLIRTSEHLTVFMAGDDEAENFNHTAAFINKVSEYPELTQRVAKINNDKCVSKGIDLYFFSSLKKAAPLLNGMGKCGVRVRRIDMVQELVYDLIYTDPVLKYVNEDSEINIAVIGMGSYGEEFVRAAVWSGQHHDYKININVFDIRNIRGAFSVKYPELADTSAVPDKADISYKINFFDGRDIFETRIEDIPEMRSVGYVFVSLGDDDLNFEAAVYLRECFARMNNDTKAPKIQTVLSDTVLGEDNINITNHKGQSYNIDFILPHKMYNLDKILNTELEQMGRKMYLMWNGSKQEGDTSGFYDFEFNYRSSISASMFWKIRQELGMNTEDSEENRRLEHKRWSAYMRSEGFRYSAERNDIAKKHYSLVPYDELDKATQEYDSYPILSLSKE